MTSPRVVRDRHFDLHVVFNDMAQLWQAYEDGYEPGGSSGQGKTPAAAVADLVERLDEAGEFDAPLPEHPLQHEVMVRGIRFRDEDDAYEYFRQRDIDAEKPNKP